MMVADPHQGGATWAVLQYILGLQQLGHEVCFIEPLPEKLVRELGDEIAVSTQAKYFDAVARDFELQAKSAVLVSPARPRTWGMSYAELQAFCEEADVLINVAGMLTDENLVCRIPIRVYLDLDPAFVQLWAAQGIDMRFAGHTHFATVGLALGSSSCNIPLDGRHWITTLQPIVLNQWPVSTKTLYDGFTTVGNWRGYGSVEHDGQFLGQKAHSLRELIELPHETDEKFLLALSIHPEEVNDLRALSENGWLLLDPGQLTATPRSYGQFIRDSKAEFGIAKSGYVKSDCGWFSDRSVCYLASGRPVLAQDTGYSSYLPTGRGLFSFKSKEEVLRGIAAINEDYEAHCQSARQIAETFFDSDKVLGSLLQKVGATL